MPCFTVSVSPTRVCMGSLNTASFSSHGSFSLSLEDEQPYQSRAWCSQDHLPGLTEACEQQSSASATVRESKVRREAFRPPSPYKIMLF